MRTEPARVGARDVALTAVLLVGTVGAAAVPLISTSARPLDPLGVGLVTAIVLPVVVRNRWPVAALLVSSAFAALYHVLDYPHDEAMPAALVLIYTVALHCSRAWLAATLGAVVVTALGTALTSGAETPDLDMMTTLGWLLAAAALGIAARAQRVAVRVANERAERAEQDREQEAARRVVEERLRIARDLHDVLAHTVVVINSHSGVAAHLMAQRQDVPAELVDSLRAIAAASSRALGEMRAMLDVLRTPADGETAERTPAPDLGGLHRLAEIARQNGLEVVLGQDVDRGELGGGIEVTVYRIAQEAVTNVIRHARASQVLIRLDRTPTGVCLLVRDDGLGGVVGEQPAGYGILGMQERARAMGGRLTAGPRPGTGFEVRAELPVGDG
jgi:signal transduction histidine kinase